jgi:hypothetical protein
MAQRKSTARPFEPGRWSSRPYLSALLRFFILVVPTAASLAAALVMARFLRQPTGGLSTVTWWAAILGSSLAVLFVVQRIARRLMPLALLLRLTLSFPDRAPSRYRVARRSGNLAELRNRLARARRGEEGEGLKQAAETILALAAALSVHDRHTRGHSERVRVFTDMLTEELKIPVPERDRLRWSALLHDVGKLEVPTAILDKAGALDEREWAVIRQHPSIGMRLIGPLVEWLGPQAQTIEHHHERYDGGGYPSGMSGEEISMGARIVAVADAYETMTAARSYKKPLSAAAAREELSRSAGKQFDPGVVRAMMNISLGRLWWRVGFLSWFAQIPLIGPASRFMSRTMQTAGGTAGVTAAAAVIGVAGVTVPMAVDAPSDEPQVYEAAGPAPLEDQIALGPRTIRAPREAPEAEAPIQQVSRNEDPAAVTAEQVEEPSGAAGTGGSKEQGNGGNAGGEGEVDGGEPPIGQEPDGGEGSGDGGGGDGDGDGDGGGSDDPGLIEFVVETVRETVDEVPPVANV